MRKKLKHQIGRLFKTKILTSSSIDIIYDVIAVNNKIGTIFKIGVVSNIDEAIVLKQSVAKPGFTYYLLEDKAILTELPTR